MRQSKAKAINKLSRAFIDSRPEVLKTNTPRQIRKQLKAIYGKGVPIVFVTAAHNRLRAVAADPRFPTYAH